MTFFLRVDLFLWHVLKISLSTFLLLLSLFFFLPSSFPRCLCSTILHTHLNASHLSTMELHRKNTFCGGRCREEIHIGIRVYIPAIARVCKRKRDQSSEVPTLNLDIFVWGFQNNGGKAFNLCESNSFLVKWRGSSRDAAFSE